MLKKRSTIGKTGWCVECKKNFTPKKKYSGNWWWKCICGNKCYNVFHRRIEKEFEERFGKDYKKPFPSEFYRGKVERKLKPRKRKLKKRRKK